jgi:hypothetical protein
VNDNGGRIARRPILTDYERSIDEFGHLTSILLKIHRGPEKSREKKTCIIKTLNSFEKVAIYKQDGLHTAVTGKSEERACSISGLHGSAPSGKDHDPERGGKHRGGISLE